MEIRINGESRKLDSELKLDQLLSHFSMPLKHVAVELNGTVVRRADWETVQVTEGDKIEVVHFVGGG